MCGRKSDRHTLPPTPTHTHPPTPTHPHPPHAQLRCARGSKCYSCHQQRQGGAGAADGECFPAVSEWLPRASEWLPRARPDARMSASIGGGDQGPAYGAGGGDPGVRQGPSCVGQGPSCVGQDPSCVGQGPPLLAGVRKKQTTTLSVSSALCAEVMIQTCVCVCVCVCVGGWVCV